MGSNKLILLFVLLVMGIAFSSAQALDTFASNQNVTLEHSVRLNGAPILASCNITVYNRNHVPIVLYAPMAFNSASQTYTFKLFPQNLSDRGIYDYDVTCLNPNGNITESFQFQITEDGSRPSGTEAAAYFFLLIVGISLIVYCIWLYLRTDSSNQVGEEGELIKINKKKYLKMFLFAITYVLVAWVMMIAYTLASVYINNRIMASIFYTIQIGMLTIITPFLMIWGLVTLIVWVRDLRLESKVKAGGFFVLK